MFVSYVIYKENFVMWKSGKINTFWGQSCRIFACIAPVVLHTKKNYFSGKWNNVSVNQIIVVVPQTFCKIIYFYMCSVYVALGRVSDPLWQTKTSGRNLWYWNSPIYIPFIFSFDTHFCYIVPLPIPKHWALHVLHYYSTCNASNR